MHPRLPFLLLALILPGCTLGPKDRTPPKIAAGERWIEPAGEGTIDQAWWTRFGDARLTALIAEADRSSPDLRIAAARLREARANRDAVAGGRLPQLNAAATATTNRVSENGQIPIANIPGFSRDYDLYDAGFDASWEIDLWGHAARQTEAATARAQAAEAEQRGARVSLRAEIARSYIELRAAQARLLNLENDATAQAGLAALVRQRFQAGEASQQDAAQAEASARSAAARLPSVQADIRAALYRLALLSGKAPETLNDLLTPAPLPQPPEQIAMGLRSELLLRRPDIASAERHLAAARADLGASKADLFPRFSLIGAIGTQARDPDDLLAGPSTRFQFGPSLHWPIFAGGTLRARVRAADARAEAATVDYEKAVLTALSESETAANRFLRSTAAQRDARAAESALASVVILAEQRFRSGEDDKLALLQARSAHIQAATAASAADADRAYQAVALYKALGGGWEPVE